MFVRASIRNKKNDEIQLLSFERLEESDRGVCVHVPGIQHKTCEKLVGGLKKMMELMVAGC